MSLIPVRGAEAQRRVLEAFALDLHTSAPGMIRSYDAATQTADILVGVKRVVPSQDDDDPDETEVFPILPAVPVIWPFTGDYFMHLPVTAGDGCLVLFCESDLNAWRAGSGQAVDPGVATRHGLSGACAILGLSWRSRHLEPAASGTGIGSEPPGAEFGHRSGAGRILCTSSEVRAGGSHSLAMSGGTDAQLAALAADVATLATAIALCQVGTSPAVPTTIAAVRAANPIASTVTKGS